MAWLRRDRFHGGYRVDGLDQDIANARRRAEYNRGMNQVVDNAQSDISGSFTGAAKTTGLIFAIGGLLTFGALRNPRSRYKLQAVAHFVLAFFIASKALPYVLIPVASIFMDNTQEDFTRSLQPVYFVLTTVVAAVWTGLYVHYRTLPKLRRLRG